ncbi:AzlC family ABC transporter permease [Roseomonas xinghualingensis]|uniref:AzlC family ABC transporter permease n=1 Tax=Roseomonas xinghualingensis TaxID=2986475 RepID=UPI0021F0F726|nr:AzlC family ABC transporter permease [Roseomonas sp. SXEYE001]MCV4206474.1 AzlC family ABC transporter permease [Roseomonas sp. SXEYE001]
MRITFTRAGMMRGAWRGLPLLIGTAPFGAVVGVIALGRGLSLGETILMSGVVFAGASQLLALELWTDPPDIMAAAIAALVVNIRMVPIGAAMSFWLDALRGWRLWGSLFLTVDQSFALSVAAHREGERDAGFLFGLGILTWIGWVVFTAAGHILGSVVALSPQNPLFFAATASFVAILAALWRSPRQDVPPWMLAAGTAIAAQALRLPPPLPLLSGAFAGAILAAVRETRAPRLPKEENRA